MVKDFYVDIIRRWCFLEYVVICNVGFENNELIIRYYIIFIMLFEKWIINRCLIGVWWDENE